ncbi:MAG: HAMP domain-containing histidine kinase [Cryomorphaceae bacterium]|nr:HAMP domain-containing histidine kinase [Cryomorphaceae bacterium]
MSEAEKLSIERELERLREFAAIVSHNLKTPIAGIKMLAGIMIDTKDEKTVKEIAEEIYSASEKLQIFYKNLENIFRNAHLSNDPPEPIDIMEELDSVLDVLQPQIAASKAEITWDFSQGQTVIFRKLSLHSVLLNLVSNAIKYAKPDEPAKVHLETEIFEKELELRVADNGIGINLDKYGDKIFGLFEKFSDHPDATGMGLYIVKNQVESVGGTIRLESAPDLGTTFIVRLPLADL